MSLAATMAAVNPAAIYDGGFNSTNSTILLRVGNGGAGQSGLIKALADAFIQSRVANGSDPPRIAWYTSDTTFTIEYLQTGNVDVGITYSEIAEKIAIDQSIAKSPSYYAFRDHFLIVGPTSNPANLSKSSDVLAMFSDLHAAAEAATSTIPVRFLSRYDKSATNIKDSFLWISIGQALTVAILLQEYTITDRGTYLSLDTSLQNQTTIYKAATDNADYLLLSPAHLLVGKKAAYPDVADAFAKWVASTEGRKVITDFGRNGQQLYTGVPSTNETTS
ncbi:hypothetical protein AOQ84DRAFT_439707 [Glonium stellatum]|uniref:PBP domain-containing protein n=1 Tax=Glonium stellatum TaxID=574774 RepID=A0A8E2JT12_9PEZI|nr:hypothetical protein AOQ84DRAFT_439707 [Glonium stellatum]